MSAPATFSWGTQSPIPPRASPLIPTPPPPRASPLVPTPTSPYLLSPGREPYPTLTSSPLLHPRPGSGGGGADLSSPSPHPLLPSPAPVYPTLPEPAQTSTLLPASSSDSGQLGKPGIPVGIAVARQRQKESSVTHSGKDGSNPPPLAWPFPLLAAHHGAAAAGLSPLLHHGGASLPPAIPSLQDYGKFFTFFI